MVSHDLEIRFARKNEAPIALELIRALAEYEKLPHEVCATERDIARTLLSEGAAARCLLAFWKGEPVGFAVFFQNYSTFQGRYGLYLEDIFVKPAFRGNGIGKALFAEIVRLAQIEKCGRVEWSVLDWNQSAIEFYEKLGARKMPEWIRFRLEQDGMTWFCQLSDAGKSLP